MEKLPDNISVEVWRYTTAVDREFIYRINTTNKGRFDPTDKDFSFCDVLADMFQAKMSDRFWKVELVLKVPNANNYGEVKATVIGAGKLPFKMSEDYKKQIVSPSSMTVLPTYNCFNPIFNLPWNAPLSCIVSYDQVAENRTMREADNFLEMTLVVPQAYRYEVRYYTFVTVIVELGGFALGIYVLTWFCLMAYPVLLSICQRVD